jgi:hypothetical protein
MNRTHPHAETVRGSTGRSSLPGQPRQCPEGVGARWRLRAAESLLRIPKGIGFQWPALRTKGLSVQEASQRLASVVLSLLGHASIRRTIEAVIRPRIHVELDRHPTSAQSIRRFSSRKRSRPPTEM